MLSNTANPWYAIQYSQSLVCYPVQPIPGMLSITANPWYAIHYNEYLVYVLDCYFITFMFLHNTHVIRSSVDYIQNIIPSNTSTYFLFEKNTGPVKSPTNNIMCVYNPNNLICDLHFFFYITPCKKTQLVCK